MALITGTEGADNLAGTAYGDDIYGRGGNDAIKGYGGADYVEAGSGTDIVYGGTGDDTIYGDSGNDKLFGEDGWDALSGDDGNDAMSGGAGNDALRGGAGSDQLIGGSGYDTAVYTESAAAVTVNLASGRGSGGNAAGDTYSSIEDVVGSDYKDVIVGNSAANDLIGRGSQDTFVGGAGADHFIYTKLSDSLRQSTLRDVIKDFDFDDNDAIDVSAIDADTGAGGNQRFVFIGDDAFSGDAGELRFQKFDPFTLVQADVNGDRVADMAIQCSGRLNFIASDFVL